MRINTRAIAIFLIVTLLLLFTVGCKDNSADGGDGEGAGSQDLIYLPEFFPVPGDSLYVDAYAFTDDKVYFSSVYQLIYNEEINHSSVKIYSMDIDGSNFSELTGYAPVVSGADYGGVNIRAMTIDDDGNIWINESEWLYNFNLPDDFNGEEHEKYEYIEELGSFNRLIQLDSSGNTLLSTDIDALLSSEFGWISSMEADNEGNIYLIVEGANEGTIVVFANDGTHRCSIKASGHNNTLVKLSDGNMAHAGISFSYYEFSLRRIDLASQSLGDKIELPSAASNIFSGGARFLYLYSDDLDLYGVDSNSGDAVHLLNRLESNANVSSGDWRDITILSDERIVIINSKVNYLTHESIANLVVFSKVARTELPEQIVLTFATFNLSQKHQEAIVLFNSTNTKYRIQVIDYSEFATADNWSAGLDRLSTELITGNAPDIISVGNLPVSQYAARGLLEDLYTFIDNDPEFSRSDFLEAAFRNAEINGGLYQIFSSFTIETLIGNPLILGYEPGWNIDEFRAVLDANPEADFPLGQWINGQTFFNMVIVHNMDNYVNWFDGTVNFETDEFIQLLELAKTFHLDFPNNHIDETELIASGRQIMMQTYYRSYDEIQIQRAVFGGDIVFKGFPSESRQGSSMSIIDGLAITTGCKNKEGAWEFLRTLLSKEWQNTLWHGFPTNKAAFDEKQSEAMKETGVKGTWGWGNITITIEPTTQEEADQIHALINSARGTSNYDTTLLTIILESIGDFFFGSSSAQDVARIIQSRASIYVSEQSG